MQKIATNNFFELCPKYLWHFEYVSIKCPKQFLYYIEFICRKACETKFKSKFHVIGWFPGLRNLDFFVFGKLTAEQVLKSFSVRKNFLKPPVF